MTHPASPRLRVVLAVALAIATWIAFAPALSNGFINYDDPAYVTANARVQGGVSASGLAWAFTTTHASNWHPLTWISHMLDVDMFGDRAGGHHATSLLLHVATAVLLFLALAAASGATGASAAAALLYGVHPLRVESVAWIAERKDVLANLFWVLAMYAHIARARNPSPWRALGVTAAMAAGLLAKPMLVTLPFALLLLDRWPLRRWTDWASLRPLVREKAPLFALSLASAIVTLVVQSRVAMPSLDVHPLAARVENAVVACAAYIGKTIVPAGLAPFYPHPGSSIAYSSVVLALVVLAAISVAAYALRRRAPYVLVGWLWFLGTLVPVIGLVQVGGQAMADRYSAIPSIGLAIAAAFAINDVLVRRPRLAAATAVLAAVVLIPLSHTQTERWRSSETLFRYTLSVTERNDVAHNNLGVALEAEGKLQEAIEHYREAVRARPRNRDAAKNLALALARTGAVEEAIAVYERVARDAGGEPDVQNNLGFLLLSRGRAADAIPHLDAATRLRSPFPTAWKNLATALLATGEIERARAAWAIARRQGAPANASLESQLQRNAPAVNP